MGYHIKGMDGCIDNPNAGWKGRALWSPISTRTPFHMEGGKGTKPKIVKFHVRSDSWRSEMDYDAAQLNARTASKTRLHHESRHPCAFGRV